MRRRASTHLVPAEVQHYPNGYSHADPAEVDTAAVHEIVADAIAQAIASQDADIKIVNLTVNVNIQVARGGGATNNLGCSTGAA